MHYSGTQSKKRACMAFYCLLKRFYRNIVSIIQIHTAQLYLHHIYINAFILSVLLVCYQVKKIIHQLLDQAQHYIKGKNNPHHNDWITLDNMNVVVYQNHLQPTDVQCYTYIIKATSLLVISPFTVSCFKCVYNIINKIHTTCLCLQFVTRVQARS